jgi:hypothetical protein
MNTKIVAALCALAVTSGTTLVAQQSFIPAPSGVRRAEALRPLTGGRDTRVIGSVIDIRQQPVAYARVQLRNLLIGVVEQEMIADANGEYEFTGANPSTYVVEMVVVDGQVVALSNAGTVGSYQTLQTVVQLPGRWDGADRRVVMPQRVSNYFGMSSQATMTAATLQLASTMNIATSDPGEPVSP